MAVSISIDLTVYMTVRTVVKLCKKYIKISQRASRLTTKGEYEPSSETALLHEGKVVPCPRPPEPPALPSWRDEKRARRPFSHDEQDGMRGEYCRKPAES